MSNNNPHFDPEETLLDIRRAVKLANNARNADDYYGHAAYVLVAFQQLDNWMALGGYNPWELTDEGF